MSPEEAKVFWARAFVIAGVFMLGVMAILYTARNRRDFQALFDEQLESEWLSGRELADAGEFFARGGVYENTGISAGTTIDQQYVLPLIRQLEEKHGLELQVLLELNDPRHACGLVAEVPQDRSGRNAIRTTVLETADVFPGLLYQHWGHRWLTLEFLDETEIKPLQTSGALAKLKASQRRMD
jgi:hypothetical protein